MYRQRTSTHRSIVARLAISLVVTSFGVSTIVGCSSDSIAGSPSTETIPPDASMIVATAAEAIAAVTSVEFEVIHSGGPVAIDPTGILLIKSVVGRAMLPDRADALVTVDVGGTLTTELGAVAVGDEIWMSDPITGEMTPLPVGFNIDPRQFFDPSGAWKPLLVELIDPSLEGSQDGQYHIRGTASGARVGAITGGLIGGKDLVVDLWIDQTDGLIRRLEFESVLAGETSHWILTLDGFGEQFDIVRPETTN